MWPFSYLDHFFVSLTYKKPCSLTPAIWFITLRHLLTIFYRQFRHIMLQPIQEHKKTICKACSLAFLNLQNTYFYMSFLFLKMVTPHDSGHLSNGSWHSMFSSVDFFTRPVEYWLFKVFLVQCSIFWCFMPNWFGGATSADCSHTLKKPWLRALINGLTKWFYVAVDERRSQGESAAQWHQFQESPWCIPRK